MWDIVEALGTLGRASGPQLCRAVFNDSTEAARVSTRRALRSLRRRGLVSKLGFNLSGECVFCLPSERDRYACLWADGEGAAVFEVVFGKTHRAFMARLFLSARLSKNPLG